MFIFSVVYKALFISERFSGAIVFAQGKRR